MDRILLSGFSDDNICAGRARCAFRERRTTVRPRTDCTAGEYREVLRSGRSGSSGVNTCAGRARCAFRGEENDRATAGGLNGGRISGSATVGAFRFLRSQHMRRACPVCVPGRGERPCNRGRIARREESGGTVGAADSAVADARCRNRGACMVLVTGGGTVSRGFPR